MFEHLGSVDTLIGVIQCAGTKRRNAGHFVGEDGTDVLFVGDPSVAPDGSGLRYARPDDPTGSGHSYRELVEQYNHRRPSNPWGLMPAWQLYAHRAYAMLVEALGLDNVYILSAGWGLVAADYLLPNYDITFSSNARGDTAYKRRRRADNYHDVSMIQPETDKHVLFFGGKDYVSLFCSLTAPVRQRTVFVNTTTLPVLPCGVERYETRARTNWHYECVIAFTKALRARR